MTCSKPRPLGASLAVLVLSLPLAAQTAAPANATPQIPPGLPTWLLPVPAGATFFGMPADKLLQACRESVNATQPERAEPEPVVKALHRTVNELGKVKRDVPFFYLGKWPVKNSEYLHFIEKTKSRFPYGWWRYGRKDDYEQKLQEINTEFPKMGAEAAKLYWERHWKDLPYALKDEQGQGIEDQPVTYVTWRDAVKFAGWIGMRLPTELELTRAMRGDSDIVWPWGNNKDLGDKYSDKAKSFVRLASSKDQVLKTVGAVPALTGPFGHLDMYGQVWQYTADLGFNPPNGKSAFDAEWKKLIGDKVGKLVGQPPLAKDNMVAAKGGSYVSGGEVVQLHVDARVPIGTNETLPTVGLRLAKTLKPGYDTLAALIRTDYNTSLFNGEQKPDLDSQAGIERYELSASGFPDAYHAVSFAPVTWLAKEKATAEDLDKNSHEKPLLIGTLASTVKLLDPPLEPGIYSVLYRKKGMPKELQEAIKKGFAEVQANLKKAEKDKGKAGKDKPAEGGEDKAGEKAGEKEKDKKGNDWKAVLTKYGLTEKDLEAPDADKINFVRVGDLKVSTADSNYLFVDNEQKYVAASKNIRNGIDAQGTSTFAPTFDIRPKKVDGAEKEQVRIGFGVLVIPKGRVAKFTIEITLDAAPTTADKPWRLPDHLGRYVEVASDNNGDKDQGGAKTEIKSDGKK